MTTDEAEVFGLSEAERRSLVRMDSGKVNIAKPNPEAKWFRLIGQPLGNASDVYPRGDEIQTVEPWAAPDTWEGLDSALLNRILTDIDAGLPTGQRYSTSNAATTKAPWPVVKKHAPDKTEAQCRQIIGVWIKNGVLFTDEYYDPVERKDRKGLHVNPSKRPS